VLSPAAIRLPQPFFRSFVGVKSLLNPLGKTWSHNQQQWNAAKTILSPALRPFKQQKRVTAAWDK
jgi:hypothetical protein